MNEETEHKIVPAVAILAIFAFGIMTFALANASEISPDNIIKLVNVERSSNGLNPVKMNTELQNAAISKSEDMIYRNYFDHYAFGQTPWMFIIRAGYNYSVAGENLAKGFNTSEGIVSAWMNSPTHRANILNPDYQDIGIGVVKGTYTENGTTADTTLTTEMMATPKSGLTLFLERVTNAISSIL
ncbi:MAG: CAP domain-containing protein [Candidatus Berkelbacteria bacterium]|nr:CAP domain-containing protein [Candidatus Berkelbacteria bacterium]